MRFLKIFIVCLFTASVAFAVFVRFTNKTDTAAPEISCSADVVSASVNDTDKDLLKYVSAVDSKDGDISSSVIVEAISPFISENSAKITYSVCDSDNNVTKLEKDIVFNDYHPPEFSFENQHVYYVGASRVDLLSGVSATDCLDGDVSSRVVVSQSDIDLSQPGIYPVTYRVTSSKGITSEITINAYVYASRLAATIPLKTYLVYTDSSSPVVPEDYIESLPEKYVDSNDSTYDYEFEIVNDIDYTKTGIHYITYRITRTNKRNDLEEPVVIAESYLAVAVRGDKS